MKAEDVMRALGSLRYGGHSCVRCKFRKISSDERCGVVGCKIALAAIDLLREKDAEIERLRAEVSVKKKLLTEHIPTKI